MPSGGRPVGQDAASRFGSDTRHHTRGHHQPSKGSKEGGKLPANYYDKFRDTNETKVKASGTKRNETTTKRKSTTKRNEIKTKNKRMHLRYQGPGYQLPGMIPGFDVTPVRKCNDRLGTQHWIFQNEFRPVSPQIVRAVSERFVYIPGIL